MLQEKEAKQNEQIEQQMRERERILKAKDYARKQREIIRTQAQGKQTKSVA